MAPICMQGQRREKHTYTALLPGTPSQPAHEEESPPHTPHLSKTALPLGMPDLSGMKRARKRRGRKKYNEPKQSAHLELSPPQTADIVSATRTSQTLRPITFAQVHHFAAVGHPVAALASAVRAPTKATSVHNLAAVRHTITANARHMIAKANPAGV